MKSLTQLSIVVARCCLLFAAVLVSESAFGQASLEDRLMQLSPNKVTENSISNQLQINLENAFNADDQSAMVHLVGKVNANALFSAGLKRSLTRQISEQISKNRYLKLLVSPQLDFDFNKPSQLVVADQRPTYVLQEASNQDGIESAASEAVIAEQWPTIEAEQQEVQKPVVSNYWVDELGLSATPFTKVRVRFERISTPKDMTARISEASQLLYASISRSGVSAGSKLPIGKNTLGLEVSSAKVKPLFTYSNHIDSVRRIEISYESSTKAIQSTLSFNL